MALMTIGYEASSVDDFLETLRVAGVTKLIDVRQLPLSRRKGFSKNALKSALEDMGITYCHLVGLGNPKEGRDAAKAGHFDRFLKVFRAHMKSAEFRTDLEVGAEIADAGGACLMCYERNPQECHRKLVSEKISSIIGCKITHLGVRQDIAKLGKKVRPRARSDISEGVATCG